MRKRGCTLERTKREEIKARVEQHHNALAVKFTLSLMEKGEYLRALESAQLRLSKPCWINSEEIGEA